VHTGKDPPIKQPVIQFEAARLVSCCLPPAI